MTLKSRVDNQDRKAETGVPPEVKFATKPALRRRMIERRQQAGAHFQLATGDGVIRCLHKSVNPLFAIMIFRCQSEGDT